MASQRQSKCLCFYGNTLDGHVAKELLRFKHSEIKFVFAEIFPTQPVFPLLAEGKYNIDEFDSVATCGVMIQQNDEERVRGLKKPLQSFDHRIVISQQSGERSGYLSCTDIVNQSGFNEQFKTSVILEVIREMGSPGAYGYLTDSIASYFYQHRTHWITPEMFEKIMRLENRSDIFDNYCRQLVSPEISKSQTDHAEGLKNPEYIRKNGQYRIFNRLSVLTIVNEPVDAEKIEDRFIDQWSCFAARESTKQPKIGAVVNRGLHNGGVSVVFHNCTQREGDSVSFHTDVSEMLGLPGNSRFAYKWFEDGASFELSFPVDFT